MSNCSAAFLPARSLIKVPGVKVREGKWPHALPEMPPTYDGLAPLFQFSVNESILRNEYLLLAYTHIIQTK